MRRWADAPRPRNGRLPDDGFSLIEIIVSLAIMMTVMIAVLPQLIVGVRGAALANQATEAKGVIQGQLERMRNLPYHVAPSAERRIDVLDTYFPDLEPPVPSVSDCTFDRFVTPSTQWDGYLSAGRGCAYEPASGSFYRKVEPYPQVNPKFVVITNTQFLRSDTSTAPYKPIPVIPPAGYDSRDPQNKGLDAPASSEIGVTVTVLYTDRGKLHPVTTYTQIADDMRADVRVQGKANATAIELGSASPAIPEELISISSGIVNIFGSLSRTSNVSASVAATSARLASDEPSGLRLGPVVAPATETTTAMTSSGGALPASTDCSAAFACWGPSRLESFTATADGGFPSAGTPGSPLEARVTSLGSTGISIRNTLDPALLRPGLKLDSTQPLIYASTSGSAASTSKCGTSRGGLITGRGYLQTTSTQVDSCSEAAATTISLFPTTFAPDGVLRIELTYAAARCTVSPTAGASTARYDYSVKGWYKDPAGGYSPAFTLTGMATPTSNTVPVTDQLKSLADKPVGAGMTLGDYIDFSASSSPTQSAVTLPRTNTGKTEAEAALNGVIKLRSQPVRPRLEGQPVTDLGEDASRISVTLGAVSCFAKDVR